MVEAGVPLRVITSAALPVKAARARRPPARRHRLEPERLDRHGGDGGLAGPGIAEQPEHLLLVAAVLEPVLDRGDGARLLRRGRDAHGAVLPAARREGAEAAEVEVGAVGDARQQLARVGGAQHVDRLVGQRLRGGRVERHMLVVERAGVLVERREERGPSSM
jgi:hypothetical protein